jgi:hypothetical protein
MFLIKEVVAEVIFKKKKYFLGYFKENVNDF